MNAYELADAIEDWDSDGQWDTPAANMLRQQADRIAELEKQTKPLSDEVLNKAFDYYCETDEGVLRFDFDLRTEWKQEQLQRWKEAFRKAWD